MSVAVTGNAMMSDRARSVLGSLLAVIVWLFIVVPRTVQSVAVPKTRLAVGSQGPPLVSAAAQLQLVFLFALGAGCFLAIALSLPGVRMTRGAALVGALAPWVYLVVRDLELGYVVGLGGLLYPLVVIAIYFLRPPLSCLKAIAHLTAATAVVSIAMAVLSPSSAIYTAQTGAEIIAAKQILPWGMLEGFLTQPNNLGQLLVLGIPMLLLLRAGPLRYLYVAVIGFALVWTASRSSIYTAGICVLFALMGVAARKSSPTARKSLSVLCTMAMTVVLVLLPLATSDPTAFSNRGYIWRVSLNEWLRSPWFGLGADWYDIVATTSEGLGGSVFHGHNQFVQTLVTGGVALALLMALLFVALMRAAARWAANGTVFGTVYLAALLGSCWLEVSIVFVRSSAFLGVVALPIAVLLLAPNRGVANAKDSATELLQPQPSSARRYTD